MGSFHGFNDKSSQDIYWSQTTETRDVHWPSPKITHYRNTAVVSVYDGNLTLRRLLNPSCVYQAMLVSTFEGCTSDSVGMFNKAFWNTSCGALKRIVLPMVRVTKFETNAD